MIKSGSVQYTIWVIVLVAVGVVAWSARGVRHEAVQTDEREPEVQDIGILLAQAAPVTSDNTVVSVHFSPGGGCTAVLVRLIDSARDSINLLAYSFTSKPISDALIRAKNRGVQVEMVLDKSMLSSKYNRGVECGEAGIDVRYDRVHAIAHNKITIIDAVIVVGGSFNYTSSAELRNAENMTVMTSASIANVYLSNFRLHRDHAKSE